MNVFDTLVERGFIPTSDDGCSKQVSNLAIRGILEKERVTAYIGFDPTAPSLHIGNLIAIMVLAHLQKAGHRPIVLMGGGTGMVGDPSGKTEMRKMLDSEQIQQNLRSQRRQFERFIDFHEDKGLLVNNAEWILKLNYVEFLREVGRHFSVNRMLTADSVKLRLEKDQGLSFLEFNYMVLQAYDFLHLFQNYGCTLQMGGDDQWGNVCAGIELVRRVTGKEVYGITYPLLTTASGAKMGKSVSGAVWLSGELLSPHEYYQYWRNVDDRDVARFLALYTFLPMEEVKRLAGLPGEKINEAKKTLAFEATRLNHGQEAAEKAREAEEALFSKKESAGESVPTLEVDSKRLEQGIGIIELLHEAKLVPSRSEARRLVEKGGAYINRDAVTSIDVKITTGNLSSNKEILLSAGKKRHIRIIPKGA